MSIGVLFRECHCKGRLMFVVQQIVANVVQGMRLVLMVVITFHGGRGFSARPT